MQSGRQKAIREHPRNICMPLVLIEDGLPMHITTQRNQIISWLVRKVQPEKNCHSMLLVPLERFRKKEKLKNVRHALKTCVKFQRHLNLSLNWVAKRLATHYFREQRPQFGWHNLCAGYEKFIASFAMLISMSHWPVLRVNMTNFLHELYSTRARCWHPAYLPQKMYDVDSGDSQPCNHVFMCLCMV